jgi:hypothetical protein
MIELHGLTKRYGGAATPDHVGPGSDQTRRHHREPEEQS